MPFICDGLSWTKKATEKKGPLLGNSYLPETLLRPHFQRLRNSFSVTQLPVHGWVPTNSHYVSEEDAHTVLNRVRCGAREMRMTNFKKLTMAAALSLAGLMAI